MELICVRLIRSSRLCFLPTLTRGFRGTHRQRELTVKRSYVPSIAPPSGNRHQAQTRTTDHVQKLNLRASPFPPPSLNVRTGLFPAPGPWCRVPVPCAPVLWEPRCGRRRFHTSAPLGALPAPLLWLVLKPLQKLLAVILGRSIRKWWVALPANQRQLLRQAAWRRRWQLAGGAAGAAVLLALFLLTHLDESPVTGRARLLVFSRENYMELAALTAEGYMQEYAEALVPEKDPRHQLVDRVVQHLAQRNHHIPEVSLVPWSVHVVDSPVVNAFVLPNGKVFMFTGMLETVADIHQLTIVLAHEMAHAVMGHSQEQASMSHVVDFLSLILLTAVWAVCPRDSLAALGHWIQDRLIQFMFSRPYSRKLEAEADQVGLQMAAKACADVRAGPVFWQQMELSDRLSGEPVVPEWLSTHPSHRNRVTQMDRLIPQALELRASCDCPALPLTDPRAVFSRSVRVLLDNAKEQGRLKLLPDRRGGASGPTTPPSHALLALQTTPPSPEGLATALLVSSAPAQTPAAAPALEGSTLGPAPSVLAGE